MKVAWARKVSTDNQDAEETRLWDLPWHHQGSILEKLAWKK